LRGFAYSEAAGGSDRFSESAPRLAVGLRAPRRARYKIDFSRHLGFGAARARRASRAVEGRSGMPAQCFAQVKSTDAGGHVGV